MVFDERGSGGLSGLHGPPIFANGKYVVNENILVRYMVFDERGSGGMVFDERGSGGKARTLLVAKLAT